MPSRMLGTAITVLLAMGIGAPISAAAVTPVKCQEVIARASSEFFDGQLKVVRKCERQKILGKLAGDTECTFDDPMAGHLDDLEAKLVSRIAKVCGGRDKTCGTADDIALADVGWGGVSVCPDLEGVGCNAPITNCGDVAACLQCIGEAALDQVVELDTGAFDEGEFGTNSAVNKCQLAIGKAATKFLQQSSAAIADCWQARFLGEHDSECPNHDATVKIAKAEAKKRKVICKACGGGDGACGTGDDLTPAEIGFDGTCPSVTVPSTATSCGGAILGLTQLVDCVDCVAAFKAECVAAAAAPGTATYPPECSGAPSGSTTTTTTTTPGTTSTTLGGTCGNGVLDAGEQCDESAGSVGGAFACAPGTTCVACTCTGGTTTTTTTTLPGGTCGNGVLDPNEECDMSSPSGSNVCPPGCTCDAATCTCVPVNGSTTTTVPSGSTTTTTTQPGGTTTTTQPGGSTTTTTTPGGTTTTTLGGGASFFEFTTGVAGGQCGNAFSDTGGTTSVKNLSCGGLNIGGGQSTVPEGPTPDGATSRFTASCSGSTCTLGPTSSAGATFDCTNTGCNFGPPLPIVNGTLSTCVVNTFASPASGTVDLSTGTSSSNVTLSSNVIVTGNATQPCPLCRAGSTSGPGCAGTPGSPCTGVCEGSNNQGAACTSTNSTGLSRDCTQPAGGTCYKGSNNGSACTSNTQCPGGACAIAVGTLAVDLSPLVTGTSDLSDASGILCPGQTSAGCFGQPSCKLVRETGSPAGALAVGGSASTTLASAFCIPGSGNILIDGAAALPGPGATSLPGTARLLP